MRRSVSIALTMALVSASAIAGAQSKTAEVARADQLFNEAKANLDAGKTAEACTGFAESRKLDPQLGTLLNEALCNEKLGKNATAWAQFNEVVDLATRAGQKKRADVAKKHMTTLERMLARVRMELPTGPLDLVLVLDGETISTDAARTTAIPIDPGPHTLVAKAKGKLEASATFEVGTAPGSETKIVVAPLIDDPTEPVTKSPEAGKKDEFPYRTAGIVVGGIGAGALVLAFVAGGVALGKKGDVSDGCPQQQCTTTDGFDANESAHSWATVSTVSFVAGAVLVAAGAALIFVLPKMGSGKAAAARYEGLRFQF